MKGEAEVAILIVFALIGWILFSTLNSTSGIGEREGSVSLENCREQVPVKVGEGNFVKDTFHFFRGYTCSYSKTQTGRIMSGICTHIDYGDGGECKVAYSYFKDQAKVCPKEAPILKYDDKCYKMDWKN
jgi:hypothetical protein